MAVLWIRSAPHLKEISDGLNSIRAQIGAGSSSHLDAYESPVTLSNAGSADLAGTIAQANQIKAIFDAHVADTLAHGSADAADVVATAKAVDLTTLLALGVALAAAYELHRVKVSGSPAVHYTADSTNTLSSTTVTTLAQAAAVMTDLKAKLNAHMASAPAGHSIRLVQA